MSYNLFLDDFRNPKDCVSYTNNKIYVNTDWIIVRCYNEFVDYIEKNGLPQIISFDHDLADEHYTPSEYWHDYNESKKWQDSQEYKEKTGYDCAKWLINFCIENKLNDFPQFYVHSMNPVGADNITNIILNYIINKNK